MRFLVLAALVAFTLLGGNVARADEGEMAEGAPEMHVADDAAAANVDVVFGAFEAFGAGDLEGVLSFISDDAAWEVNGPVAAAPEYYGRFDGKDAIRAWFNNMAQMFPDQNNDLEEVLAVGDDVVLVGREHGTLNTGKPYDENFVLIFGVEDGKIVSMRGFEDSSAIVDALR